MLGSLDFFYCNGIYRNRSRPYFNIDVLSNSDTLGNLSLPLGNPANIIRKHICSFDFQAISASFTISNIAETYFLALGSNLILVGINGNLLFGHGRSGLCQNRFRLNSSYLLNYPIIVLQLLSSRGRDMVVGDDLDLDL